MVPRQFDALVRRHREERLFHETGPAMICQMINALGGVKSSYTKFMPSYREEKQKEADWKDLMAKVKVLHTAYGGVQ